MQHFVKSKAVLFVLFLCLNSVLAMQPGPSDSQRQYFDAATLSKVQALLQYVRSKKGDVSTEEFWIELGKRNLTLVSSPVAHNFAFSRTFSSADRQAQEKLIKLIRGETQGISAAIYQFNLYRVAYELCRKKKEGVPVKLILNYQAPNTVAQLLMMRCNIEMKHCRPSGGGIMHQKCILFDANAGIVGVLNREDEEDRVLIEACQNTTVPLEWSGSYNLTGNADAKNSEQISVVSNAEGYLRQRGEFDTLFSGKECSSERIHELGNITTFPKTDLTLNGIPSANILFLLKSKFYDCDRKEFRYLSPEKILTYHDFVPHQERNLSVSSGSRRVLPQGVLLPFPCFFWEHEGRMAIAEQEDSWLYVEDLLKHLIPHAKLKLHGIGSPVAVDVEKLFFRDDQGEYCTLLSLQSKDLSDEKLFSGPYQKSGEKFELIERFNRKTLRRSPYPFQQLKILYDANLLKNLLVPCSD